MGSRRELFSPARFPVFNLIVEEGRSYAGPARRAETVEHIRVALFLEVVVAAELEARDTEDREPARVCRALLPGGSRADVVAEDVPLREHA
jgi:hypothetical protein